MHIPDGFLDAKTIAASAALSLAGLGLALRQAGKTLPQRKIPLMGLAAAFIFAAQMLNFPIPGATSGHVIGGVLAAVLLGPFAAVIVLTSVLMVQCLMFADGGVLALGANVFNLAIVHPLVGYIVYRAVQRLVPGAVGILMGSAFGAWLATVVAAISCAGQLALSGKAAPAVVFSAMASVHMLIGIGEGIITAIAVAAVLKTRPELIHAAPAASLASISAPSAPRLRHLEFIAMGLLLAVGLAVFVSPFASSFPDGLEKVAGVLGFEHHARDTSVPAPLSDYEMPGFRSAAAATAVAGALGTVIMFGLAFLFGKMLARKPRLEESPGPAVELP